MKVKVVCEGCGGTGKIKMPHDIDASCIFCQGKGWEMKAIYNESAVLGLDIGTGEDKTIKSIYKKEKDKITLVSSCNNNCGDDCLEDCPHYNKNK